MIDYLKTLLNSVLIYRRESSAGMDSAPKRERPWPTIACVRTKPRGKRIAVYAGSFDPVTKGHLWMIEQGSRLFDRLTIAVGSNPGKKSAFSMRERLEMLRESTERIGNVSIAEFANSYLIHYAQSIGATHILRGIRSGADYEFERAMRNINADMDSGICTVFLMPPRDIAEISSSMVKGLIGPSGWKIVVRKYVPAPVYKRLLQHHS